MSLTEVTLPSFRVKAESGGSSAELWRMILAGSSDDTLTVSEKISSKQGAPSMSKLNLISSGGIMSASRPVAIVALNWFIEMMGLSFMSTTRVSGNEM